MMNTLECSTINNETLSHHFIINQMISTTGCTYEQAKQLLISNEWKLQGAINLFLDNRTIPISCKLSELRVPANTPATPPNFPEILLAFRKLSASETTNDNQIASSPININMITTDETTL